MTKIQKIKGVLTGIFLILLSAVMAADIEVGSKLIVAVLSLGLLFKGISSVRYYFGMARHMVGGRMMLYKGVVLLDLAAFTMTLSDIPALYVVLYILAIHAFSGAVDVLRALESKRIGTPAWKFKLVPGIVNIAMAGLAVFMGLVHGSLSAIVYIYAIGLLYSGIMHIVNSFRRTAIVYIQ